MQKIVARPLLQKAFAPFGEVIEKGLSEQILINNNKCIRHHALATADVVGEGCSVIINIFSGQAYAVPHTVSMVERHPLGSQAFFPLGRHDWLVIVCEDEQGRPVRPQAFLAAAHQGVNIARNVWHGVLTPLTEDCDFLVVDRGGPGNNLEEFHFTDDGAILVELPSKSVQS